MSLSYHSFYEDDARAIWPEVEPLAIAIFGADDFSERVNFHGGIFLVIARDEEGRVVGFKIGYRERPKRFVSWLGGVDATHRGRGIGDELMRRQHAHVASTGCPKIWTITSDAYPAMLRLNLRHGFRIIGSYTNSSGKTKLILERRVD